MGDLLNFHLASKKHHNVSIFVPANCTWNTLEAVVKLRLQLSNEQDIKEIHVMNSDSGALVTTLSPINTAIQLSSQQSVYCEVHLYEDKQTTHQYTHEPVEKSIIIDKITPSNISESSSTGDWNDEVDYTEDGGESMFLTIYEDVEFREIPTTLSMTEAHESTFLKLCISGESEKVISMIEDNEIGEEEKEAGLRCACRYGCISTARALVAAGIKVDSCQPLSLFTPLQQACICRDESMAEWLLGEGASATILNSHGTAASHYICVFGLTSLLSHLSSPDLQLETRSGMRPLHYAAGAGQLDVLKHLISTGVDLSPKDRRLNTPLHYACEMGRTEVVNELLKAGAEVDAINGGKCTPLLLACRQGHLGIVQELALAGANVFAEDREWNSAMHFAAQAGSVSLLQWLVTSGKHDPHIRNRMQEMPVDIALKCNKSETHEFLRSFVPSDSACNHGDQDHSVGLSTDTVDHGDEKRVPCQSTMSSEPQSTICDGSIDTMSVAPSTIQSSAYQVTPPWSNTPFSIGPSDITASNSQQNSSVTSLDVSTPSGMNMHDCNSHSHSSIQLSDYSESSQCRYQAGNRQHGPEADEISSLGGFESEGWIDKCSGISVSTGDHMNSESSEYSCSDPETHTFLQACARGDVELIHKLLSARGDMYNVRNENGSCGIHFAATCGRQRVLEILVNAGTDVNTRNNGGSTPLHFACQQMHDNCVKWLITVAGASIKVCNNNGLTPVHVLCTGSAVSLLRWMASFCSEFHYFFDQNECGDQSNSKNSASLLECACESGNAEMLQALLDIGVSSNLKGTQNRTALHVASSKGVLELAQIICERPDFSGVDAVDCDGKTALFYACLSGSVNVVKYLLNEKADFNIINSRGNTCMHAACQNGDLKIVRQLVTAGMDVNTANLKGDRPTDFAVAAKKETVLAYMRSIMALERTVEIRIRKLCLAQDVDGLVHMVQSGYDVVDSVSSIVKNPPTTSVFHTICRKGLLRTCSYLCSLEVPLDVRDPEGYTPLHICSAEGHYDLLELLLDSGADYLMRTDDGRNCVHLAAKGGHLDVVRALESRGVAIDDSDLFGMTPLLAACSSGKNDVVQYLLQQNANIDAVDANGMTAMHYACKSGVVSLVEHLSDCGVSVDSTENADCSSPFLCACESGALDVAKWLLTQRGCNIFFKGGQDGIENTALHLAAGNGHMQVAEWLVHCGLQVGDLNFDRKSPIHLAEEAGHHDLAKWLVTTGSSIYNDRFLECLDPQLIWALNSNFFHLACVVLNEIFSINNCPALYERSDGSTLLHSAAAAGDVTLVGRSFKLGIDIEKRTSSGSTAVHYACLKGHVEVVKCLKILGAKMKSRDDKGNTGFHIACECGHEDIVVLFTKILKSIDITNRTGWTGLHLAASVGHTSVIAILIDAGADVTAKVEGGVTALHLAGHNGFATICLLLLQRDATMANVLDESGCTAADRARHSGFESLSTWLERVAAGEDVHAIPPPMDLEYLNSAPSPPPSRKSESSFSSGIMAMKPSNLLSCVTHSGGDDVESRFDADGPGFSEKCSNSSQIDGSAYLSANKSLISAVENGDVALADSLLKSSADIQYSEPLSGNTALHIACKAGNIVFTKFLVQTGANIDAQNIDGMTPLHISIDHGQTEISQYLIRAGALVSIQNKASFSPLHFMAIRVMVSAVRELAELPKTVLSTHDLNVKTNSKQTALHLAVASGSEDLVEEILRLDISIDTTDSDGQTALHIACAMNNYNLSYKLLEKGSYVNKRDDEGRTPLHFACAVGNIKLVQMLVDNGGMLSSSTRSGDTLLHTACKHGRLLIAKWLVSCGLDIDAQNKNNQSARYYAENSSNQGMLGWVEGL